MNSYMRSRRSVTLAPIAMPSRSLKVAIDLRDLVTTGFWPVIAVRSATAPSTALRSLTASPTPMLMHDLVELRHLEGVLVGELLGERLADGLGVVLLQSRGHGPFS